MNKNLALFLLLVIGVLAVAGFSDISVVNATKDATNKTTIECIEKPTICKQRYDYLKLGEKLGENK
jgi:hypothetical protein